MQPLVAGPRAGLTESQVTASLAWGHSTRIRWGVDLLNSQLEETGLGIDVIDASVQWQWRASPIEGEAPVAATVRRVGSLLYKHRSSFNPLAVLYKPWIEMQAPPSEGSVWVRWHLGVFTATIPPYQYDGMSGPDGPEVLRPLELADRSHLWQSDEASDPFVVPTGTDLVQWVRDDLAIHFNEYHVDGIVGDSPPRLASQDYVFAAGTPWMDVYNTLLGAVGNDPLHTDADGLPVSAPLVDPATRTAEHSYNYGSTVLAPAEVQPATPELPNALRFVASGWDVETFGETTEGNGVRTVYNDLIGPACRQARGGATFLKRIEVPAQTQLELDAQAKALAAYYFAGGGLRYIGKVGLNPRHDDSDVVFLEKPPLGIQGNWLVTSWRIGLGEVEQMATMDLELEQLTGTAFASTIDPFVGSYGTEGYGVDVFGGHGVLP